MVCVHTKAMKDPWFLVTSRADLTGSQLVKCNWRFTCEENFRDTKDIRFGMGLSSTHISVPDRRDRLLLLGAMAQALLTLLGAAGGRTGLDWMLKANTVKRRTRSLFRQGCYWYGVIEIRFGDSRKSESLLHNYMRLSKGAGWNFHPTFVATC